MSYSTMTDNKSNKLIDGLALADEYESPQDKAILSFDNLGILASIACLIHCAAMPFVVAAIPFLGMQFAFLQSETTENILIAFIIGFAVIAIIPGYRKHKKPLALLGLVLGIGTIATVVAGRKSFLPDSMELPVIALGNTLLVITHLMNRKFIHGSFFGHAANDGKICCNHDQDLKKLN